jgi:hypothetical protein
VEASSAAARLRRDFVKILEGVTGAVRVEPSAGSERIGVNAERRFRRALEAVLSGEPLEETLASAAEDVANGVRQRTAVGMSAVLASTDAGGYVSADLGVLHAREIEETGGYLGVNFYLSPVDKRVPLSRRGGFSKRFAFTAGILLRSIQDDRKTRDNLFWNQSVVAGAGFRLARHVRLGAGALLFRERDPETFPLSDQTQLAVTPYVSLSFDADVGGWFGQALQTTEQPGWRTAR